MRFISVMRSGCRLGLSSYTAAGEELITGRPRTVPHKSGGLFDKTAKGDLIKQKFQGEKREFPKTKRILKEAFG